MKQTITRILDVLIPPEIREQENAEELTRAQVLVFLELLVLAFAALCLTISLIVAQLSPSPLNSRVSLVLTASLCGYVLSLWIFRQTGHHVISGNIFALTFYTSILVGVLTFDMSAQRLISAIMYLLALPLLVTFIANYLSGLAWVVIVAVAPLLLDKLGNAGLEQLFLGNWAALCLGLFMVIYSSQNYLNHLSQRLNTQCSWLEFAVMHDSLTGIANRAAFDQRLQQSIERCNLHSAKTAVVYVDLDRFKPINDRHGHQAGDIVLITIAERLLQLVRRSDTVARLGGDEFALIFDQCSKDGVKSLVDCIETVTQTPIEIFGKIVSVGCSIGVAVYPDDGVDADQLKHKADKRMYVAKHTTKMKLSQTGSAAQDKV